MPLSSIQDDASAVIQALNANNFTQAWNIAEESTALYGGGNANDAPTTDPLVAALESSQGLKQLDPGKVWTPDETTAYYKALGLSPGYTGAGTLGKNPYGLWGSQGAVLGGQDASANIAQEGVTPDVQRFAGSRPSPGFFSKWGAPILELAAAVAAPYAIGALAPEIAAGTGLGAAASGALAGAAYGAGAPAAIDAITGHPITGKGELIGGLAGGIGGAIQGSGLTGIPKFAASEGGKALTGAVSSGLSSGSQGTTGSLSPGVMPVASQPMSQVQPFDPNAGGGGFLSGLESGLASTLGGTGGSFANTLGSVLGTGIPYAAVAGIGMSQAQTGEAQSAKYGAQLQGLAQPAIDQSNALLGNYNKGINNPATTALANTEVAQGNQILNAPGMGQLSKIAQQAFSGYLNGQLQPAQQMQLDQQVAAQKSQVAQSLASAGIADSTILAAQNQQIDNNALITKQQMINSNFATGTAAYDQWLQTTEQGQATIQQGLTVASNGLQTELQNSMQEAGIGIGEMNVAIQTQMQTDANYAEQVSQLLGTLATAYAKQVAGQQANRQSSGGGGTQVPSSGAGFSQAPGTGALNQPVTPSEIAGLTAPATSDLGSQISQEGADLLANDPNLTTPLGGWLDPSQLGGF